MRSVLLILSIYLSISLTYGQSCQYVTSEWSSCFEGLQNRTMSCVCNHQEKDLSVCQDLNMEEPELVQTCTERICTWKWTRWTRCTATCDGGNTTRSQICMCEGEEEPTVDADCDPSSYYGEETADCNTFACDNIPAFNKIYWTMKADEGQWPMADDTFQCSKGYDVNSSSPFGKHYSTILRDNKIEHHDHPEWYYLAKEWIAAELNVANGVPFPDTVLTLINTVADILEKCDGYDRRELYMVYAAKEKLGRINNNIGGLDHVDEQLALLVDSDNGEGESESYQQTMIMIIVIPGVAILVVLIVAAAVVMYVRSRQNTHQLIENANVEDDEEAKAKAVGLEQSNAGGEHVEGERFDEEE